MKLYIGVNSDKTVMISKKPLKRFIDFEKNKGDVLSYNDTLLPPHWILDYTGITVPKIGDSPTGIYIVLPEGSLQKLLDIDMSWEDEVIKIDL